MISARTWKLYTKAIREISQKKRVSTQFKYHNSLPCPSNYLKSRFSRYSLYHQRNVSAGLNHLSIALYSTDSSGAGIKKDVCCPQCGSGLKMAITMDSPKETSLLTKLNNIHSSKPNSIPAATQTQLEEGDIVRCDACKIYFAIKSVNGTSSESQYNNPMDRDTLQFLKNGRIAGTQK